MSEPRLAVQQAASRPLSRIETPNRSRAEQTAGANRKPRASGFEPQEPEDNGHSSDALRIPADSAGPRPDSPDTDNPLEPSRPLHSNDAPQAPPPPRESAKPIPDSLTIKQEILSGAPLFTARLTPRVTGRSRAATQPLRPAAELQQRSDTDTADAANEPAISVKLEDEPSSPSAAHGAWETVPKKSPGRRGGGGGSSKDRATPSAAAKSPRTATAGAFPPFERPPLSARTVSTPALRRKHSGGRASEKASPFGHHRGVKHVPSPLDIKPEKAKDAPPSPAPVALPLPPASLSTYLQLELSSAEVPAAYLYRPRGAGANYESTQVKLDRLLNFLSLPPHLEEVMWFGAVACFDAWLHIFTILPLRFVRALAILLRSWARNAWAEFTFVPAFIYAGVGRVWRRWRVTDRSSGGGGKDGRGKKRKKAEANGAADADSRWTAMRHRRCKSVPSALRPVDKADILKGFLVIASCIVLMHFDASMMYHMIRGQATIKLYVIYNVLEVLDRLLSAIGQDVLECLFSKEALERKPNGRSKVLRPLWLFLLALVYNVAHAIALFYQVITLNVAVNSYSNALLTLLLSNQFVEIKGTVFKRFEKENLFQITCADIVERFQLWVMLVIIAGRNLIETNALFGSSSPSPPSLPAWPAANATGPSLRATILPSSFTVLPSWAGEALGPFVLVLGTETLVDWVKHAYITKFNATTPRVYGRFLDVLARDCYTHAFAGRDLVRRLGLPVFPLACLFIRAAVQTGHMFLATHLPLPLSATAPESPESTAALLTFDQVLRRALRRHLPADAPPAPPLLAGVPWLRALPLPGADALIAACTAAVFCGLVFLVLLAAKVALGMAILAYARRRMQRRLAQEGQGDAGHAEGVRRVGGWGAIEVDDEKRGLIYEDDAEGLRRLEEKERERQERERRGGETDRFEKVERYSMVAKRIW